MPKGYTTLLTDDEKEEIKKLYTEQYFSIRYLRTKYKVSEKKLYEIINPRNITDANKIGASKRPKSISPYQRQKISETMKKIHSENKHPGWSHINTDANRRSYPEKVFLDQLIKYKVTEMFTIVEKLPVSKYFLDFAVVDLKVDIEIDGSQHLREDWLIHDKERNEYLKSKGWKVYRISFHEMKTNLMKVMNDLVNWLRDCKNNSDRFYTVEEIKLKKIPIKKDEEYLQKLYETKRKFNISKQELETLIKEKSMCEIGRMFGVSSNAIKKRCKRLNIQIEKYFWQNKSK